MFHLTFFGGTEGEISPAGFTAFTCFGGADLRRPTLASQILHLKRRRPQPQTRWERLMGADDNLVITVFGGTVIRTPSLAEEFVALQSLLNAGTITRDELPGLLEACADPDRSRDALRTLTLFGGCGTKRTSEKQERKALQAAANNGSISDSTRRALEALIDSPPGVRERGLGSLVAAPA